MRNITHKILLRLNKPVSLFNSDMHILLWLAYCTIVKCLGEVRIMAKKKRQSIEQFREFVKLHPQLRNEVKQKQTTWQELFEEWYLLGDSHPRWDVDQKETERESRKMTTLEQSSEVEKPNNELEQSQEFIGMILGALKNMDINQIQQYIKSANQAIGTIQGVLDMFQGSKSTTQEEPPKPVIEERKDPFMFRKD
jgi:Putative coat protein